MTEVSPWRIITDMPKIKLKYLVELLRGSSSVTIGCCTTKLSIGDLDAKVGTDYTFRSWVIVLGIINEDGEMFFVDLPQGKSS